MMQRLGYVADIGALLSDPCVVELSQGELGELWSASYGPEDKEGLIWEFAQKDKFHVRNPLILHSGQIP